MEEDRRMLLSYRRQITIKSKEKMRKDNWWNRIFHRKQVEEERDRYDLYKNIEGYYDEIMSSLKECKSLEDIMDVHKRAWRLGFQNTNLAPCSYGMFRCQSIETMTPEQVFLGNRYGLATKNIPFWESYKDETMAGNGFCIDETTMIYDIIMSQYRRMLTANFNDIRDQVTSYIIEYETINRPEDPYKVW